MVVLPFFKDDGITSFNLMLFQRDSFRFMDKWLVVKRSHFSEVTVSRGFTILSKMKKYIQEDVKIQKFNKPVSELSILTKEKGRRYFVS